MIPNDYFITKLILPQDTSKIQTDTKFTYPITEDKIARDFFKQAIRRYKITFLIPTYIMTANPTNKLLLLDRTTITIDYNLTFLITS